MQSMNAVHAGYRLVSKKVVIWYFSQTQGAISKTLWTNTKWVTLMYLYHLNCWGTHKKLLIAKLDFVQVCGLSLNFYNNTLRKFYKFSNSRQTWTSPTLQSADWPISRQYHQPQMRKRVSYPEVYPESLPILTRLVCTHFDAFFLAETKYGNENLNFNFFLKSL